MTHVFKSVLVKFSLCGFRGPACLECSSRFLAQPVQSDLIVRGGGISSLQHGTDKPGLRTTTDKETQ